QQRRRGPPYRIWYQPRARCGAPPPPCRTALYRHVCHRRRRSSSAGLSLRAHHHTGTRPAHLLLPGTSEGLPPAKPKPSRPLLRKRLKKVEPLREPFLEPQIAGRLKAGLRASFQLASHSKSNAGFNRATNIYREVVSNCQGIV